MSSVWLRKAEGADCESEELFGQSLDTAEDFLPFFAEEEELLIQEGGVCSPGPLLKKADGHLSARDRRDCCTGQRLESPHLPKCTPKCFCAKPKQRPAACETGTRCSPITPIPVAPAMPGPWSQGALLLPVSRGAPAFKQVRRGWEGSVSLRASQREALSQGAAGWKSHTQISVWSKGPTKSHRTHRTQSFQRSLFSGEEFQPLRQKVTPHT